MPRFSRIIIAILLSSCTTSHAQNKTRHIKTHKYVPNNPAKLIAPANYKPERPVTQSFISENFEINLYARKFVRGDAIYLEIHNKKELKNPVLKINGKEIPVSERIWGYRGIFTIHPERTDRNVDIELSYKVSNTSSTDKFHFLLDEKEFPVSKSSMDVGKYSRTDIMSTPEVQNRISKEWKEKMKIFSHLEPDHLGNAYAHPRDSHVTSSPFYKKRIYEQFEIKNGKKIKHKPKISYHRGFDFRAKTGDFVFAMGAGKVALAKELYFEGNCVWIDHGNRILSVYMHMSKLNVYKGQMVKPGQLIGYVGSTGVSTGPHLHVALFIDSIPTDPMSLLALPLRK